MIGTYEEMRDERPRSICLRSNSFPGVQCHHGRGMQLPVPPFCLLGISPECKPGSAFLSFQRLSEVFENSLKTIRILRIWSNTIELSKTSSCTFPSLLSQLDPSPTVMWRVAVIVDSHSASLAKSSSRMSFRGYLAFHNSALQSAAV